MEGIGENLEEDNVEGMDHEQERSIYNRQLLLCHLNINSVQNKFEELRWIILKSKIQLMIVGETKIDSSYPDSQFHIPGYSVHRYDGAKGGGGIMAFISSSLQYKRLKLDKRYKTFEPIAFEIALRTRDIIVIGIYRPQRKVTQLLEDELYHICNWAALQKQAYVLLGDLNLDRLKPNRAEGKLLHDLEEAMGLQCLINQPTRITNTTQTLIDVILTNQPDLVGKSGVYNPELSDHSLVYSFLWERVSRHSPKIIKFRSSKNFDPENFKNDLLAFAPWQVGEVFDDIDDQAR